MVHELIIVGGLFFWGFLALFAALIIGSVETEKPGWATGWLVIGVVLFALFGNANPLAWVFQNTSTFLTALGGYLVIGVLWSVAKWWFYNLGVRDRFEERRTDWLKSHKAENLSDEKVREQFFRDNADLRDFPPRLSRHKSRIMLWMGYWPFSALWTLVNDPVKRFFRWAYARMVRVYEGITKSIFSKYEGESYNP